MAVPVKVSRMALFIQRMTQAERRYFRENCSGAEPPLYLEVFTFLEQRPGCTADEFNHHFQGRDFMRNPASLFNYLSRRIRSSLVDYYSNHFSGLQLAGELQEAKVLFLRGFVTESIKLFRSIRKRSQHCEDPYILPQALYWERKALFKSRKAQIPLEEAASNANQNWAALKQLLKAGEWEIKFYQLVQFIYGKGHFRRPGEMQNLRRWIRRNSSAAKGNFEATYHRLNMLSRITREEGDWKRSHSYRKELVQLIESRPQWSLFFTDLYATALSNLASSAMATRDRSTFERAVARMKSLQAPDALHQQLYLFTALMTELNAALEAGDFASCKPLAVQAAELFEPVRPLLVKANEILFHYYFAYAWYANHNYKECQRWIQRLLSDTAASNYLDVHCMAHVLSLLVWCETGNPAQVLKSGRLSLHFVKQAGKNKKLETLFIRFLLDWARSGDKQPDAHALQQLLQQVRKLLKQQSQKIALDLFHFEAWAQAMLLKQPYAETAAMLLRKG